MNQHIELTLREKEKIATIAKEIVQDIESGKDPNYYGPPLTQSGKEQMLVAIQTAMEMNKRKAKAKFTPKKYRKGKTSPKKAGSR
ncbi:hypothetical protein [Limosilactobacillus albertensis]|uniref:Uncharacterized protein n=1 Tax=Limosilactobacillus albertensis TaxID=2759752 RepID=A0A839HAL7_9LACO|nr:hypothetical protein [Limosilactobacillus albertensis]MBB1122852.1 hypothetical protein [Limosilactobacillus albertensis]MCD7122461.1 hypothetical protein [Limosilactobacillus albertensis]